MFTNGTLLHKIDLFDSISKNLEWIRFSIDSGTEKTYNDIRRTTKNLNDFDVMLKNVSTMLETRYNNKSNIKVGAGFVITPDNYTEILDFAKLFSDSEIDYCQYKPEIVNRERENGIQREIEFWKYKVEPLLNEAKNILGDKFQINGYKLSDLQDDPELFGRRYKKCLGSQLQPCVGADGHVYVCTNHRGYKQYSYGSLYEKSFKEIWNDVNKRKQVMYQIDDVEKFCNCTALCKPHESNKAVWRLYQEKELASDTWKDNLIQVEMSKARQQTQHWEFI